MRSISRRHMLRVGLPAMAVLAVGLTGCGGVSDEERAWALSYQQELLQLPEVAEARVDLTRESGSKARLTIEVVLSPDLSRDRVTRTAAEFRTRFAAVPIPGTLQDPYRHFGLVQRPGDRTLSIGFDEKGTAEQLADGLAVAFEEVDHGARRVGTVLDHVTAGWNVIDEAALLRPIAAGHQVSVSRTATLAPAGPRRSHDPAVEVSAQAGIPIPEVPLEEIATAVASVARYLSMKPAAETGPTSWSLLTADEVEARDGALARGLETALRALRGGAPPGHEFTVGDPWSVTLAVADQVTVSRWGTPPTQLAPGVREGIVDELLGRVNAR